MEIRRKVIFLSVLLLLSSLSGCMGKLGKKDLFECEQVASRAYRQGDYELAIEQYKILVTEIPKDTNFWFKLANAYAKNGERQKAVTAYQNALLRDPTYAKAWYNMGMVQMQLALRTFIDFQEAVPSDNPMQGDVDQKIEGLFKLIGQDLRVDKKAEKTK